MGLFLLAGLLLLAFLHVTLPFGILVISHLLAVIVYKIVGTRVTLFSESGPCLLRQADQVCGGPP